MATVKKQSAKKPGTTQKREKTGGRKAGTPNKLTRELKDAILNAFEKVGGEDYLVKVAKKNPAVFCQLLGKVLPIQLTGKDGKELPRGFVVEVVGGGSSSSKGG